jgi:DNA-binding LacI/PurR family transcriptional regulator
MPKAITTIQQHSFEKGRMAARLFIENRMSEDVVMPTELLIGESCP